MRIIYWYIYWVPSSLWSPHRFKLYDGLGWLEVDLQSHLRLKTDQASLSFLISFTEIDVIMSSLTVDINFTLQCLNLSQDGHEKTNCLHQRGMLVASKRVVDTIRGILIFSNKYSRLLFSRNKQRIREEQRVRSRELVMPFVWIFTNYSWLSLLLGIVKSCEKRNDRKTSPTVIHVFVLTVADVSLERRKLDIVIHLLTQTLRRVKTINS